MGDPTSAALKRVLSTLTRFRVSYVLIGGLASGVLGRPRTTMDIDILVGGGRAGLSKVASQLQKQGAEKDESFSQLNPLLRGTMIRMRLGPVQVDLLRSRDRHDQITLRRRQKVHAFGMTVWLPRPEDLILLKMKTGRDRDLSDCIGIFEAQRDQLSLNYLKRLGIRLRLMDEYYYVVGSRR